MNVELSQYYNSLTDKDSEGIKYYFDITAVNSSTGMQNTICSASQSPKKATGAERFKEVVTRAEAQKYNVLHVREYSADGQTVVNSFKFTLGKPCKNRNKSKSLAIQQNTPTGYTSLEGFESNLERFGFVNGLQGVVAASAEKLNQEYVLQQQTTQLSDLKTRLALLEQEKESLKKETESYKERYKEILDEKKELERDYKHEIEQLKQKLSLGSLAVNGALGFLASRPGLSGLLAGIMGQPAATPTAAADSDDDDDEDDDDITIQTTDPQSRQFVAFINQYCGNLDSQSLEKVCTVIQFMQIPGNLDYLTTFVKAKYKEQQKKSE